MTNWIEEGNECLTSDSLYSAKEYRRIIRGLLTEIPAAYEAGALSVRNELEQEGRNF